MGEEVPGAPQLGWASGLLTATSSEGGPPKTDSVGYTSRSVFYLGPYACGSTLTLQATPGMGDYFSTYTAPGENLCASSQPTCTLQFVPTQTGEINYSLNAFFAITTHRLTIVNGDPTGGIVRAAGNQVVTPISCGNNYNGPTLTKGTACSSAARAPHVEFDYVTININANGTPDPEYGTTAHKIASVTGCDQLLSSGPYSATCNVAMTEDKTVTVSWAAGP